MHPKLTSTLAALFLAGTASANEPPTAKERLKDIAADAGDVLKRAGNVITEESREAWTKTKAYLSTEPDIYRKGAEQKAEELTQELARLRQDAATIKDRPYFETRLTALEQHRQFAQQQLAALPADEIRQGRENPRRRGVDTTLERLEEHLAIAQKEMRDFTAAPR